MTAGSGARMSDEEMRRRIEAVPYWFHRITVAPGVTTPGEDDTPTKLRWLQIPEDLRGLRVLDIGCYEGFFTFECERRGAEVTAIDIIPRGPGTGFHLVHELLGSKAVFHQASIYDLTPENFGEFDLVLCLGVLYHLRHPLLGIERIHSVCRGRLIIETQICDRYFIDQHGKPADLLSLAPSLGAMPIVQFYPGSELNGDPSNWWSPNVPALKGMLQSSGFVPTKVIENGVRACMHCDRLSPVEHTDVAAVFLTPQGAAPPAPAPVAPEPGLLSRLKRRLLP